MKRTVQKYYITAFLFFIGLLIGSDIGNFKDYVKKNSLEETRTYWGYLEYKLIPDLNMSIYGDRFGGSIMEAMINADILFRKENGLNDLTAIPEFECKDKEKENYVTKIGQCYVRAYKDELISELDRKRDSYTTLQNLQILLKELFHFLTSSYSSIYVTWFAWAYFLYPTKDEEVEGEQPSELTNNEKEEK
ncbi:hypothetical protein [Pseudomonas amygdali]|uniref:hypothetical protein n=1 Tax=Pseudomonas amygdali TaxID=47877 RepID=UPI0007091095|nr:hypothetical protein [Pseudomonas amygdali]KWS79712.1 hypothetical protein AL052_25365 [Pseudomonas amygdali pv. eriobotryae]